MATTLALAMRASMSASGVVSGANQAAGAMDKMGRQAQQTARDVSVLKDIAIGATVAKGISAIASVFTSAGTSLRSYISNVTDALDAMNDLAQRTGMGVEALQALQMAGRLSGVEDVTSAVQKLAVAIGQAAASGNTEAFTRLGLNFQELQAMSPEDQFRAIQAAISALPTEAARAAAAVAIFGRAGVELLPLMNENLAEIEARMRRLGAIVSEDQVAAIDEMNDALAMVRATFDGIIGQISGNLAPLVTAVADTFMEFVEAYDGGEGGQGGTGIANAITEGLFKVIEALAAVVDAAVNNFNKLAKLFEWSTWTITRGLKGLGVVIDMFTDAASDAAGDTTGAQDTVAAVRARWEENQTPEAQEKRRQAHEQRNRDRKAAVDAKNAEAIRNADLNKLKEDARQVVEMTRTAEEKHADEMWRLDRLYESGVLSENTYLRAKEQADKKLQDEQYRAAADQRRAQEQAARAAEKAAAIDEKMAGKRGQIDEIAGERAAALGGKSNEALKANDIRSGEGMAQFLALATGREDPAIAEYRKQTAKLEEIKAELRALQAEKVEILGAAA